MERTRKTVELPETWQERKLRLREEANSERWDWWLNFGLNFLRGLAIILAIFILGAQIGMLIERERHQPKVEQEP